MQVKAIRTPTYYTRPASIRVYNDSTIRLKLSHLMIFIHLMLNGFHQVLKQVQLWCCLQHGVPQVQHQTCNKNKNCVPKFVRSSSSTPIGSPWTSNIVKSSLKALVSQISRSKNQNIKTKKSLKKLPQIQMAWLDESNSNVNANISLAQFDYK